MMKTVALAVLAGVAAGGLMAAPATAQDKEVQLKISLWIPPAHPLVPATQEWAKEIEKASGGTIKSVVFPSEQLGKAVDHYDMARDGIADMTYVSPGYQPGRFPIVGLAATPFIFADGHKGTQAFDAWYRKYAAIEMKDTHVCFGFIHDPGAFHSRKKIVMPDDVKGLKVRPAHATVGQMVAMLGGTNVQASAPEAREVLERRVADAITFPWGSVFLFGIDKVVNFHMDAPLYTTPFVYTMNLAKYASMSAAQKKVMDDHCTTEWAEKVTAKWSDFEFEGRDKMRKAPGHEVYPLTAEQTAAWKKTVEPLRQNWAEATQKIGVDPKVALAELEASLAKYQAGF
ncbi:MAG: TRAP transporter substrate-binding protein [Alphaproteobacteria bacterium]|nr:TRAP transporter substrate-binding protein [Alphaproteobacteria bacterium]